MALGDVSDEKYERIKEFHVGGGWFRDGAHGNYDYYNAWGFHYSLYWLDQINPEYDPQFIRSCMAEFVTTYRYLMTPQGIPFFWSQCLLSPGCFCPITGGSQSFKDALHIGEAKRALEQHCVILLAMGRCVLVFQRRDYLQMTSDWWTTTVDLPVVFGHYVP
ncbi:Uncharacterized protein conserved in bacteria [Salmonella enterica subsp. arizonae]|uniref:Uncharacterized protein conserved in bacteria n=1 Tax=Salmonella enterica subsp. arizonae TaxID=59203 RepID=A0A3S4GL62_SALER|nr:Uncharacterized protein conserved in bacteria [Salmonella enterica subsp. arizonae]